MRMMFAGTKNSPVAKNVMNLIILVFVSLTNGRMKLKTCVSISVFLREKTSLMMNARLIKESKKRISTMTSSMDKSAKPAKILRSLRTMEV